MSKFPVVRALMASAAVVFVAACSTEGPVAPRLKNVTPLSDVGIAAASVVQVCVDPASSATSTYTVFTTGQTGTGADPALTGVTVTPGNAGCVNVLTKNDKNDLTASGITINLVVTSETGTLSYSCVTIVPTTVVDGCQPDNGTNGATAYASGPHGSTVTYLFVAVAPPTGGCTYTHGWYKNHGNSTVPTSLFFGPVVAGVNTGPVTWRVQVGLKATAYDKLAYQYIAAKLSVGAGTPPPQVAAALLSAEAFFTNRPQGTGTPPAGVAETLDLFVNGGFAADGWPHC